MDITACISLKEEKISAQPTLDTLKRHTRVKTKNLSTAHEPLHSSIHRTGHAFPNNIFDYRVPTNLNNYFKWNVLYASCLDETVPEILTKNVKFPKYSMTNWGTFK